MKTKINNLKQLPNNSERGNRKYNNGIEPTTNDTTSHPNA